MNFKLDNSCDDNEKLQECLIQREQEELAIASINSEILSKLDITLERLPQKCQQILHNAAKAQISSELAQLDPVVIALYESREITEKMNDEYEILKLRQKSEKLQGQIDRNDRFLEQLRADLIASRERLSKQSPNPDTIQEYCRQMRHKVASYEQSCEKAKSKYTELSVPEHITPTSLASLATSLSQLSERATSLRRCADDIALAREARHTLRELRR